MSTITVQEITKRSPDPRSTVPGLGLSGTLYGVEVEIENVRSRPECTWWQWVDDGSLRNHGAELVLRQPTGGADLIAAFSELKELIAKLTVAQASPPEITERCSVHCHIDFRGSTFEQVLSFFIGWCCFEAALYTIGGKDRYDSIYCPGMSSCRPQIKMFNKLVTAKNASEILKVLDQWPKYTAVNLSSLLHHGSVEVRSHKGTYETQDVVLWIQILDTLKKFTDTKTPKEVVTLAARAGTSFAVQVFGALSSHLLTDNYQKYNDTNISNAFDCLYWSEVQNLNKDSGSTDAAKLVQAIRDYLGDAA